MSSNTIEVRDQRANPWYWIDHRLVRRDGAALGVHAIAVYNILASFAHATTQKSFPGRRTIAEMLGISPTTVDEANAKLESSGWIKIVKRKSEDGKANLSNVYILLDPPGTPAVPLVPKRRRGGTATGSDQESVVDQESGNGPKPPKGRKLPDIPKEELDALFDLICEVCSVDREKVSGSSIGKIRTALIKVGWTSKGLAAFRDYRQAKKLGPVGSIHWLQDEMAKTDWRNKPHAGPRKAKIEHTPELTPEDRQAALAKLEALRGH